VLIISKKAKIFSDRFLENKLYRKWQIFRLLKFSQTYKAALWTKITALAVDPEWTKQVIEIVDKLVASEVNMLSLIGSTDDYQPGLTKLDVIEWSEGTLEARLDQIKSDLLAQLAALIGRDEILGTGTTTSTSGSKAGFS
jgi:hypothetical protein